MSLLHLPLVSDDGVSLYTGHTFRVSGAQRLAAMGIPEITLKLLARWASDVVLRYAREAPLVNLTKAYTQGFANVDESSAKLRRASKQTTIVEARKAKDDFVKTLG